MAFVLVPVPKEHVYDVMRWVLFRADAGNDKVTRQDVESVEALLADADDDTRRLLLLVAVATARDEPLRVRDLADDLGCDVHEMNATIDALNLRALEGRRLLLERRKETAVGVDGQTGKIAYVSIRPDLVRVVRAAGQVDEGP